MRTKWLKRFLALLFVIIGVALGSQQAQAYAANATLNAYYPGLSLTDPKVTDSELLGVLSIPIQANGDEQVYQVLPSKKSDFIGTQTVMSMLANNLITLDQIKEQMVATGVPDESIPVVIAAYGQLAPYFVGYTMSSSDAEETITQQIIPYSGTQNAYYYKFIAHKNNADVTVTLTNGTQSESRKVTGVKGLTSPFFLEPGYIDTTTEVLLDEDNQPITIAKMPKTETNDFTALAAEIPFTDAQTATYRVVLKTDIQPVTITYQYADGTQATDAKTLNVVKGDAPREVASPTIDGYTADQATVAASYQADQDTQAMTVTYQKDEESSSSSSSSTVAPSGSDSSTTSSSSSASNATSSSNATNTSNATSSSTAESQATVNFKPFKVYAKRALYTYSQPTFKKADRQAFYPKRSRNAATSFKVVGTATSNAGRLRYRLVNGQYITANPDYVANLYWQSAAKRVRITNQKGAYLYQKATFAKSQRIKHLKKGTIVRVKKIVNKGYTTRYYLANGQYLTGNKQWVTLVK